MACTPSSDAVVGPATTRSRPSSGAPSSGSRSNTSPSPPPGPRRPCGCGGPDPASPTSTCASGRICAASTSSTPTGSPRTPSAGPPRRCAPPSRPTAGPGWSWPPTPSYASPGSWSPTSDCPGRNHEHPTNSPPPASDEDFGHLPQPSAPRPDHRNPTRRAPDAPKGFSLDRVDSGQGQPAGDEVDDGDHLALAAVAAGLALGGLHQAVGAFKDAVAGTGAVPVEDAVPVGPDHAHELLDRFQPAADRAAAPAGQVRLGELGRLVVETVEVPPPAIRPSGGQPRRRAGQPRQRLGLAFVEPLGAFQPHILAARQLGVAAALGLAHVIHRGVELGDDVVTVEGDLGVDQLVADPADERRGHVAAHAGDLRGVAAVGDPAQVTSV